MNKLFDETYDYGNGEYRRTIWYGYMDMELDNSLLQEIKTIIKSDYKLKQEYPVSETHWILYSNDIHRDAIKDKVRFAIYIRYKNGKYITNINIRDFDFASRIDEILCFKEKLEKLL